MLDRFLLLLSLRGFTCSKLCLLGLFGIFALSRISAELCFLVPKLECDPFKSLLKRDSSFFYDSLSSCFAFCLCFTDDGRWL